MSENTRSATLPGPSALKISAFYRFAVLNAAEVEFLEAELTRFGLEHHMRGLVLLGTEGINGTVSGTPDAIDTWEAKIRALPFFGDIEFKTSACVKFPFRQWKVQVRQEIVTIGDPSIHPKELRHNHLSPFEWEKLLVETPDDVIVLDTRNQYETEIGKFKNAIAPEISDFKEFPKWVEQNPLPKNKTIMIYCTGGIRCEKAIFAMERQGYDNVFQLQGGILNYLSERPGSQFEGECFVFDRRVAVQHDLSPSIQYETCPHCGQTATDRVTCVRCGSEGPMCKKCETRLNYRACSKNCAYHLDTNPMAKGRPQIF